MTRSGKWEGNVTGATGVPLQSPVIIITGCLW